MMNVQIFPSRKRVEPNDKLTEKVFSLLAETYYNMVTTGSKYNLVEVTNHKKYGEILTPFWLNLIDEYTDTKPLTQFDRSVLSACISEWSINNRYTTPNIIYRHITGKIDSDSVPTPEQQSLILASVRKLMCTQIKVNMTDVCEKLCYNNGQPFKRTAQLLPARYDEDVMINGNKTTIIKMLDESPIFTIARMKNQLLTYEEKLLDLPKQYNSVDNISVKNYVIQRVQEIKLHKLVATIRFDDVFQKCRLSEAHSEQKRRTRKLMTDLMNHLKAKKEIIAFEVHKEKNKFAYISFEY